MVSVFLGDEQVFWKAGTDKQSFATFGNVVGVAFFLHIIKKFAVIDNNANVISELGKAL